MDSQPQLATRAAKFGKWGVIGAKLGLMLAIVLIGGTTFGPWVAGAVKGDGQAGEAPAASEPGVLGAPPAPPLALAAFEDGAWEFAGAPWSVGLATIEGDQVERFLSAAPEAVESIATAQASETEMEVLRTARMFARRVKTNGSLTQLVLHQGENRATLWLNRAAGGEVLSHAQLAWPETEGRWRVLEARRLPAIDPRQPSAGPPLPYPAGAQPLAMRYDSAGAPVGRVVTTALAKTELLERYRQMGWRQLAPSGGEESPVHFLQRRGAQMAVQVASHPEGPALVFLTPVAGETTGG